MNIHVYLCPFSPSISRIPELRSVIQDRLGNAKVLITVDDGLHEDCCFIDGNVDSQDIYEINLLLQTLPALDCAKALAVV